MAINEKLNSILEDGEHILWSGVPQPYSLFDPSRKSGTMLSLCLAAGWAILSIGGYYALTLSQGGQLSIGVILFLLCFSLMILWMPISDKTRVKKLSYAVTDKKIIVVSTENTDPVVMRIKDIDGVRIDQADNGNCHVRAGKAAFKASPRKLPVIAHRGEYTDENGVKVYKGIVFFNVTAEDGKTISNLLKKDS